MAKRKKRPLFNSAGTPRRGQPQPSKHEEAVMRRIARGHLLITQLERGSLYTYETGDPILDAKGRRLDDAGFARLQSWLTPDRGDTLFPQARPQVWRAKKPGGSNG
jgi:hypothetical protein